jgi:hypothetical protein
MGRITIQIFKDELNPRTLRVPESWFTRAAVLAWLLVIIAVGTTIFAVRLYQSDRSASPTLIQELENEVQQLKIALEKSSPQGQRIADLNTPSDSANPDQKNAAEKSTTDPLATDARPTPGTGTPILAKDGVWSGLARGISAPPIGTVAPINIEDARIQWTGKQVQFSAAILFQNAGKGSQQGRLVILARGSDRIYSHPAGALNFGSGDALMQSERGEYFSVSRYRPIKTTFGPFENQQQLSQIQVFAFNTQNQLIFVKTFSYEK